MKCSDEILNYRNLLERFPRVNEMIIHSADKDFNILTDKHQIFTLLKQEVTDQNCCGIISSAYFNLNLKHYLESKNYNTCLNRKVSVDSWGNIKNCPSMKKSYGSIFNSSAKDVVGLQEFQDVWKLKKDDISDCKVCEFRHVCTDCRAYLDKDNSIMKPARCNYDPYTASWK